MGWYVASGIEFDTFVGLRKSSPTTAVENVLCSGTSRNTNRGG